MGESSTTEDGPTNKRPRDDSADQDQESDEHVVNALKNTVAKLNEDMPDRDIKLSIVEFYENRVCLIQDIIDKMDNIESYETMELPVYPHDKALTEDVKLVVEQMKVNLEEQAESRRKIESFGNNNEGAFLEGTMEEQQVIDSLDENSRQLLQEQRGDMRASFLKMILDMKRSTEDERLKREMETLKREMETLKVTMYSLREAIQILKARGVAIREAATKTKNVLGQLCHLSQERIEPGTLDNRNQKSKLRQIDRIVMRLNEDNENLPASTTLDLPTQNFLKNIKILDDNSRFSRKTISQLNVPDELNNIAEAFNAPFSKCERFLRSPYAQTRGGNGIKFGLNEYKKQVCHVKDTMTRLLFQRERNWAEKIRSIFGRNIHVPGPRSQEVEGVQPLIDWVLEQTSRMVSQQERMAPADPCTSGKISDIVSYSNSFRR